MMVALEISFYGAPSMNKNLINLSENDLTVERTLIPFLLVSAGFLLWWLILFYNFAGIS